MTLHEYLNQPDPQHLLPGTVKLTRDDVQLYGNPPDCIGVHIPELSKKFGCGAYYVRKDSPFISKKQVLVLETGSWTVFSLDFDPFETIKEETV